MIKHCTQSRLLIASTFSTSIRKHLENRKDGGNSYHRGHKVIEVALSKVIEVVLSKVIEVAPPTTHNIQIDQNIPRQQVRQRTTV